MATIEELDSARRGLDTHLRRRHLTGGLLRGPDPGVRFNARIHRFVKSYTRRIPWRDDLVYAQAQKYWIEANALGGVSGIVDASTSRETVERCADALLTLQTPDGYWPYPNPEWAGRIATVEGNYGAIGLLIAHRVTGRGDFVDAAVRWHDYAVRHIGFQVVEGTKAINYFGGSRGSRIPNNAASSIRAFAMLADASGDDRFLEHVDPMVAFMADAQMATGELPYGVAGETSGDRIHFLCYQYNAFQFLNLVDYREVRADPVADDVLARLAVYLEGALTEDGRARYDCASEGPDVVYYAVACARALRAAHRLGLVADTERAERAIERALGLQRRDGSFPYSFRNYGVLHDLRSYPRYLAMILTFLTAEIHDRRTLGV